MENNQEDEGQKVSLIGEGISFRTAGRQMDTVGLAKWVESIKPNMPQLIEEENVVRVMTNIVDAFVERYLSDKATTAFPGYVLIEGSVLTKLTRGGLTFDPLIEVIPQVDNTIEAIGFCQVFHLFHSDDYKKYDPTLGTPYLGRIKIVDLNQLFYQG